jgi:hypothetical protein
MRNRRRTARRVFHPSQTRGRPHRAASPHVRSGRGSTPRSPSPLARGPGPQPPSPERRHAGLGRLGEKKKKPPYLLTMGAGLRTIRCSIFTTVPDGRPPRRRLPPHGGEDGLMITPVASHVCVPHSACLATRCASNQDIVPDAVPYRNSGDRPSTVTTTVSIDISRIIGGSRT